VFDLDQRSVISADYSTAWRQPVAIDEVPSLVLTSMDQKK